MRIIGITGGKGGTGKSTIATALACELAKTRKVLLVDADVDCPNDHLILSIERSLLKVVEQRIPAWDLSKCTKCGACARVCRTNAIVSVPGSNPIFMENQCNGCGACRLVCPSGAIGWSSKEIGRLFSGKRGNIDFLSGELKANQPVSEFIVNHLNEEMEKTGRGYDYVIIDTAAGTHCPVIAALEKADGIVAVTEPTPLGAHDLEIILQLLEKMNKNAGIVINRSDLGDKGQIEGLASRYGARIVLEVPFSREIIDSYSGGKPAQIANVMSILER
ncbi:ATP-binding protein [Candidatus Woesearchaeota archaeon]|nr:ATP-binding protein [Candidatus Woesearchaeota archaeon]